MLLEGRPCLLESKERLTIQRRTLFLRFSESLKGGSGPDLALLW